jgi:hypothetical protein
VLKIQDLWVDRWSSTERVKVSQIEVDLVEGIDLPFGSDFAELLLLLLEGVVRGDIPMRNKDLLGTTGGISDACAVVMKNHESCINDAFIVD